tara:strand:+ start:450 stop:674 length:225 start_codon:yes stop_codon:yes gene_type:complete
MKNKDLQEFLKQHPDDMEVVMMPVGWTYETTFDFEVTDVLLNSVPDDEFRIYYRKDYDGYWSFQYTPTKVLLIY